MATFHSMSDDIRTILGYKLFKPDQGNFARIKKLRKWRKNNEETDIDHDGAGLRRCRCGNCR